jgi:hypothetical protein
MGVTFWGNFASRTLLVPFHWRGMRYAHHSAGKGRCACEKLKKRRQSPWHRGGSAAYEAGRPGARGPSDCRRREQ